MPRHILSIVLEAKTRPDEERLATALASLAGGDSTFRALTDSDTGQTTVSGTGELELESVLDRLLREYKVEVNAGKPQVIYCETIRTSSEAEGRYIRQTGGSGNYGHVKIRVDPNEPGKGYEFINDTKGGVIAQEYINAIDQGIQEAVYGGVIAGYEIIDIKVCLFDGSYHEVNSNQMAFKIAGSMAFKEAARNARPVVLEPVMALEVVAHVQSVDAILADISNRCGRIESIESLDGSEVIKATAPLRTMIGYANVLRGLTHATAKLSMAFAGYEQTPRKDGPDDGVYLGVAIPKSPQPGNPRLRNKSQAELDL